jgi:hypothetical protein
MNTIFRFALPAVLAVGAQFPATALAQSAAHPAPMNSAAAAPPLAYESAFTGYQPGQEPAAVSWKESNARVTQPLPGADEHAGHAGHNMGGMKHGAEAKPADPHAGHDMGSMDHGGHKKAAPAGKKDPHHGHQHKE